MSSNFKPGEFNVPVEIQEESVVTGNRVVKTDVGFVRTVQEFKFQDFKGARPRNQASSSVALADDRFVLSGLAKEALHLEEDERAQMESDVQQRVSLLTEAAREAGQKQGYEEGHAHGREEAVAEIRETFKERLDHLESMIQAVEGAKEKMFKANERLLVDLIHQSARMVILKELSVDREYLTRLVTSLIEKVSIKENLSLKISPKDAETLDALRGQLSASFPTMKNLTIELSEDVQGGGCHLETEWGAIDASVATQVARIEQNLLETFKGNS